MNLKFIKQLPASLFYTVVIVADFIIFTMGTTRLKGFSLLDDFTRVFSPMSSARILIMREKYTQSQNTSTIIMSKKEKNNLL